jgi:hypothetical protein
MPKSESQVRPLLALPRDRRLACWQEILSETPVDDLTGKVISRMTRQHAETNGIEVVGRQHPQKKPGDSPAIAALQRLKVAVAQLENAEEIQPALLKIERLIRLSSEA